jgi:hypothetical protein
LSGVAYQRPREGLARSERDILDVRDGAKAIGKTSVEYSWPYKKLRELERGSGL